MMHLDHLLTLTVPARLRRAGKEMRIVLEDGSDSAAPDPSLLRLLIRANAIRDRLLADRSLTLEEIAKGGCLERDATIGAASASALST